MGYQCNPFAFSTAVSIYVDHVNIHSKLGLSDYSTKGDASVPTQLHTTPASTRLYSILAQIKHILIYLHLNLHPQQSR
jgi:hypothetical protein